MNKKENKAYYEARSRLAENNDVPAGLSDCYIIGMTYGCIAACPQFQRGECEIFDTIEEMEKANGDSIYLDNDKIENIILFG